MPEEKKPIKMPQNVIMEDRRALTITGVNDIDSFDEQSVVVFTELGELTVRGFDLHMNKIDVETGELSMEGDIQSLSYSEGPNPKGGFFSKLFR